MIQVLVFYQGIQIKYEVDLKVKNFLIPCLSMTVFCSLSLLSKVYTINHFCSSMITTFNFNDSKVPEIMCRENFGNDIKLD